MDGYTPEPETKYENDYQRSYMQKKNNRQTPEEREKDMEYYVKNLINLPTNESKKNTVKLTESELKNIIAESVKNALKEGTTFYDDGIYSYQGIGTPESQERVKKLRDKSKYNRFNLPYLKKAEQSNGDITDKNSSVYRMLYKFSQDVDVLYHELLTKLEKVDNYEELKNEIDKITFNCRNLSTAIEQRGLLKRDFIGEPSPHYKGK
mgnify:CR=1 FL=1